MKSVQVKRILFGLIFLSTMLLIPLNASDFNEIERHFGSEKGDTEYASSADLNQDGIVDGEDIANLISTKHQTEIQKQENLFKKDYVLVQFMGELNASHKQKIVKEFNSTILMQKEKPSDIYTKVTVPEGNSIPEFVEKLKSNPMIRHAQPDFFCYKLFQPNDSLFSYQWNFNQMDLPRAWDLTLGGNNTIVVAVIDTGVAYEDYDEYSIAPDFQQTSFVEGYDFINSDTHANDDDGHGTHVAGTVAQSTNNSYGTAGIAFECSIMPIKALNDSGSGTASALADGIRYAIEHGADVINMSLGFPNGVNPGSIIEDQIQDAYQKGIIVVAASGNDGDDGLYNGGVNFPAAYDYCIAVGATRYDKRRSYYSNWGQGLTCVAPGGDVRVDQNRDGYGDGILQQTFVGSNYSDFSFYFFQGTSMASPHVAAAAALFKARHGGGFDEFLAAIQTTSEDLGTSGYDQYYGYGLINISKIVRKGKGWGGDS